MTEIVVDTTVYRSFGALGLGRELLACWQCLTVNTIFDPPDGGELGRIVTAIAAEVATLQHGSAASTMWLNALTGIEHLLALLKVQPVIQPVGAELLLAERLASKTQEDRDWRHGLGILARRIDAGEAACMAVAITRGYGFATDDRPAAGAYEALAGVPPLSSFDALDLLATNGTVEDLDDLEWRLRRLRGPKRPQAR